MDNPTRHASALAIRLVLGAPSRPSCNMALPAMSNAPITAARASAITIFIVFDYVS